MINEEIKVLSERLARMGPLIKLIVRREWIKSEMKVFEKKASNPQRLFGSSTRLLEEEKFRKIVATEFPKLTQKLQTALVKYETKYNERFVFQGKAPLSDCFQIFNFWASNFRIRVLLFTIPTVSPCIFLLFPLISLVCFSLLCDIGKRYLKTMKEEQQHPNFALLHLRLLPGKESPGGEITEKKDLEGLITLQKKDVDKDKQEPLEKDKLVENGNDKIQTPLRLKHLSAVSSSSSSAIKTRPSASHTPSSAANRRHSVILSSSSLNSTPAKSAANASNAKKLLTNATPNASSQKIRSHAESVSSGSSQSSLSPPASPRTPAASSKNNKQMASKSVASSSSSFSSSSSSVATSKTSSKGSSHSVAKQLVFESPLTTKHTKPSTIGGASSGQLFKVPSDGHRTLERTFSEESGSDREGTSKPKKDKAAAPSATKTPSKLATTTTTKTKKDTNEKDAKKKKISSKTDSNIAIDDESSHRTSDGHAHDRSRSPRKQPQPSSLSSSSSFSNQDKKKGLLPKSLVDTTTTTTSCAAVSASPAGKTLKRSPSLRALTEEPRPAAAGNNDPTASGNGNGNGSGALAAKRLSRSISVRGVKHI